MTQIKLNYREELCHYLFQKSAEPYAKWFKKDKKAWGLSSSDLLDYPKNTFGYQVGLFLSTNGFEFFPKHETHDLFHVVTGYGVSVKEEIALQYLLYGNGKRSFYLYFVMSLGFLIVPEHYKFYKSSYQIGKSQSKFYHNICKEYLEKDFESVKVICIKK